MKAKISKLAVAVLPLLTSGCAFFMERHHSLYVECKRPDGSATGVEYSIDAASPEPFEAVPNEGVMVSVDKLNAEQRSMTVTISGHGVQTETIELEAGEAQRVGPNKRVILSYHWDY